jgi:uncharacterized protein YjbI with pentapeptide repeats
MTDQTEEATPRHLTPANQNPWYVLATLFGEQEGEEIDWELHAMNRAVWNAWSFHNLPMQEIEAQTPAGFSLDELAAWHTMERKVAALHEKEWRRRNDTDVPYPGMPDVLREVDFEWVAFSNTLVMERFIFRSPVLASDALFSVNVWFDRANFLIGASFQNAVFNERADFASAVFRGESIFAGAAFFGDSWFGDATLSGGAWFTKTRFLAGAGFRRATFNRHATFIEATFGAERGDQTASFADCQFDKPLNFRGAKFLARYPVFSGAITADRNVFTAKPDHWPQTTTQDLEQARESCAAIRHMLDKQGLPEEAHFFFRREMDFASQIGSIWQRLPYLLYGKLSDYGHSIRLPFEWLAALIVTGWAIFSFWLALFQTADPGARWHQPLVEGLSLSIANSLPFLGLMRSMHPHFYDRAPALIDFLSIAQSLAGIVLLFLLGLGLRTRFRMR